ncbi:MAG: hypothetical protein M1823_006170, partial [Watsoniomyces obsoletus]
MSQLEDDLATRLSNGVSIFADPVGLLPTEISSLIPNAQPRSTRTENDRITTTQSSRSSPRPATTESSTTQRRSTDNASTSTLRDRTTEKTDTSSTSKTASSTTSSPTPTSTSSSSSSSSTGDSSTLSTIISSSSTSSDSESATSTSTITLASAFSQSTTQPTSSSATSSIPAASVTSSPAAAPAKAGMSQGGIIVASVSGTLAIFSIVLLLIFCVKRRRRKDLRPRKDSWIEEIDLGRSAHSRSASGSFASRDSARTLVPPLVQPRRVSPPPLVIPSKELQLDIASPVTMHPPQGYTRPARVHSINTTQRLSQDSLPQDLPKNCAPGRDDTAHLASQRDSLFLPTSVAHPPPIRQLQPSLQPSGVYQAYKPFASRHQLPTTIPEEESPIIGRSRHSVDGSPPKIYLPGERTRSPPNDLPASLTVGRGTERPASADAV